MNNVMALLKANWLIVAVGVLVLSLSGFFTARTVRRNRKGFKNWFFINGPESENETRRQIMRRYRADPNRKSYRNPRIYMP